MTGHQINSLVGDLVAMAQAMEQLPKVQQDLHLMRMNLDDVLQIVQDRELSIIGLKSEIELLHTKLREAEVAKDAAETMFLEADDRTSRALDFVKTMFGSARSLIQALEPSRAEPTVEDHEAETLAAKPYEWPEPILSEVKPIAADWEQDKAETSTLPPQGQSEPDPTHGASTVPQEPVADTTSAVSDAMLPVDDFEPTRYDEHGNARDAWLDWARRTDYWASHVLPL